MDDVKMKGTVEKIAIRVFCVMCGIVMLLLFAYAMQSSGVNENILSELVTQRQDIFVVNVLGMLAGLLLSCGISAGISKLIPKKKKDFVAVLTGVICMAVSIYWINATHACPMADQKYIINYAIAYAHGDTSSLLRGEYIANYPQQLGLITFLRVLFLLFGEGNYKAFQYMNAGMVFLIVYAGSRVVRLISGGNDRAEYMYLIFALFCIPMYGYTPFVYGEIPSTALSITSVWLLLAALREFRWWKLILLAIVCGGMVQFRENTLIFIIAFLIVVLIKFLQTFQKGLLAIGGSILAGVLVLQLCVSGIYKPYLSEDTEPIPALLFVAMGTHDTSIFGPGWHDESELLTYQAYGYDSDLANAAAKQEIKDFVRKSIAAPGEAAQFYARKIKSQWNAPMYQCLVMNNFFSATPTGIARRVYYEGDDDYLQGFMEIYQLLVYGGAILFLSCHLKDREGIEKMVLMIGVFGGFWFSILWEAKTRYIFPYFIMMLPCAAVGITELYHSVILCWKRVSGKKTN